MKYLIVQFDQILKQTILTRSNINFQFVHVEYDCLIEKQSFSASSILKARAFMGIHATNRGQAKSTQVLRNPKPE